MPFGQQFVTQVDDAQGQLVLNPASERAQVQIGIRSGVSFENMPRDGQSSQDEGGRPAQGASFGSHTVMSAANRADEAETFSISADENDPLAAVGTGVVMAGAAPVPATGFFVTGMLAFQTSPAAVSAVSGINRLSQINTALVNDWWDRTKDFWESIGSQADWQAGPVTADNQTWDTCRANDAGVDRTGALNRVLSDNADELHDFGDF
jgi:hypothetical protein